MTVKCTSANSSRPGVESDFTHLIDKLDALAAFYQQQMDWVDKTTRIEVKVVETELSDDDQLSEVDTRPLRPAAKPLTSAALRRMHWRRQMRSLESKLNGQVHKRRRNAGGRQGVLAPSGRKDEGGDAGSHYILDLFGQMIKARAESCRRVQKMVAFTNKPHGKHNTAR
ncbi:hypothetical protein C8R44DRAFT_732452 [Mycena epipterygia]|nr:hypothetical protein C8R44DRAFT_732452 [Mycena epipterygia]